MTRVEVGLVRYLRSYGPLARLIGPRLYPGVLPEAVVLPAVTYERVSGPRLHSHSGPSGLAYPRYQFTVWAKSYNEVKEVSDALRFALDGYKGDMGDVKVHAVFVVDDRDMPLDVETMQHRVTLDAIIWHEEGVGV